MIDMTYDSQITAVPIKASETSPIGTGNGGDAVNMLLAKLDEGTHTITNLRSILTLKTAELNELISQLELTNQAITRVESTTTDIENMLRDFGLSSGDTSKESLLMSAEASLDLAIKSASSIYPQHFKQQSLIRRPSTASTNSGSNGMTDGTTENKRLSNARLFTTRIRYKPDTKHILRKLNDLLRDLELDSGKFFSNIGTTDDFEVLQKAYVDLDIAKTIALSAKSNMKRRNILARSARRRNNMDEIQLLGDKIREGVAHWMTCTSDAPLLVNGEDILTVLDREDNLLAKNLPIPSSRGGYAGKINNTTSATSTPSSSTRTRSASIRHSFQNDTMEPISPIKRSSHSRSSSTVTSTDFAGSNNVPPVPPIPAILPPTPVLSAASTNTSSTTTTKKLYRQSAGPRLTQVKANIGLPRVRTTSITQQKDQQQQHPKTLTPTQLSRDIKSTPSSSASSITSKQSHIPLPPSQQNTSTVTNSTNTMASPDSGKKSLIKPPAQRGPGSTLRLRSMLAKRGQAPTSLTVNKPPTMKNNNNPE